MTTVLVKKYRLIDGLNGRTIEVDDADIATRLQRLGRPLATAERFAEAVARKGVPYWAADAQATLMPNPAYAEDNTQLLTIPVEVES